MANIQDVARLTGVSKSSVSRAINNSGYVSKDVRERILKAATKLQYSPNQIARSLKLNKSNIIALFVPTVFHPFFAKIAYCIEDELYQKGYKTIIVNSQGNKAKETKLLDMIKQNQVDGIIFITHHIYEEINQDIPIVTIDRHLGKGIPCITSDNYAAIKKAVQHLVDKGCQNIGFIGGKPKVESEVDERIRSYQETMKELKKRTIISYEVFKHGEEMGFAQKFLNDNPKLDAIIASGDTMAFNIYQCAQNMGIKVPEQLKIIAYDGVINEWFKTPSFTACKQNIEQMALAAVTQLLARIDGKEPMLSVVIDSEFILGETA